MVPTMSFNAKNVKNTSEVVEVRKIKAYKEAFHVSWIPVDSKGIKRSSGIIHLHIRKQRIIARKWITSRDRFNACVFF